MHFDVGRIAVRQTCWQICNISFIPPILPCIQLCLPICLPGLTFLGVCVQGHLQFFMKEHEEAMKTYEQGLTYDKDNQELKEGLMRCQQAINKVCYLSPWPYLPCNADRQAALQELLVLCLTKPLLTALFQLLLLLSVEHAIC